MQNSMMPQSQLAPGVLEGKQYVPQQTVNAPLPSPGLGVQYSGSVQQVTHTVSIQQSVQQQPVQQQLTISPPVQTQLPAPQFANGTSSSATHIGQVQNLIGMTTSQPSQVMIPQPQGVIPSQSTVASVVYQQPVDVQKQQQYVLPTEDTTRDQKKLVPNLKLVIDR